MSVCLRRGFLVLLTALVPVGADACCLLNPFDSCGMCGPPAWIGFTVGIPLPTFSCGMCCPPPPCPPAPCGPAPCGPCQIGPTLVPPISTTRLCPPTPVCTTLQPRQVTTIQNVPSVEVRREAYVENVPVTTYEQITVPRTVYQPQTRYRDVAVTVNRQVARTHTEYVRQPVVGYTPPLTVTSAPCPTCPTTSASYGLAPQYATPSSLLSTPVAPYAGSMTGSVPTPLALPSAAPAQSQAATLQQPQPYAENSWQSVPQRQAQDDSGIQQMGYYPAYSPPPASPSRSMFQPAPSAASVWQSRWMR